MTTVVEDAALMELRVKLYGAAQVLKGVALEDLKTLVRELARVLDLGMALEVDDQNALFAARQALLKLGIQFGEAIDLLDGLHRGGGLGLDVHQRIGTVLESARIVSKKRGT